MLWESSSYSDVNPDVLSQDDTRGGTGKHWPENGTHDGFEGCLPGEVQGNALTPLILHIEAWEQRLRSGDCPDRL